jgi:hypothetical protein
VTIVSLLLPFLSSILRLNMVCSMYNASLFTLTQFVFDGYPVEIEFGCIALACCRFGERICSILWSV